MKRVKMNRRLKKNITALIILSMITTLTGCWDKIEIDERAFVLAMAVDMSPKAGGEQSKDNGAAELTGEQLSGSNKKEDYITALLFMPIPSKLLGGEVDTYSYDKAEGLNMPAVILGASMKQSRKMCFSQMGIILVGKDLIKNEKAFREFVDFLEREPEMGREAMIAVLDGKMDDLIKIKPTFEKVFAQYMSGIFTNAENEESALVLPINELLSELRGNNGKTVMPVVTVEGDKAKVGKIALINQYKLDKYLEAKYIRPFAAITRNLNRGIVIVPYERKNLTFKIRSAETKVKLDEQDGKLKVKIISKIEGDINDYFFNMEMFGAKRIQAAQSKIKEFLKEEIKKTTAYFQNEVGTDYLLLKETARKHNYKLFEKYKDKWDDEFRNAVFEYDINVFIRRLGAVKK